MGGEGVSSANIFFIKRVLNKPLNLNRHRLVHFITYDCTNLLSFHASRFHKRYASLFLGLVFSFFDDRFDTGDICFGFF